jgi:hypothetical protein
MRVPNGEVQKWRLIEDHRDPLSRQLVVVRGDNERYNNLPMLLSYVRKEIFEQDLVGDVPQTKDIRQTEHGLRYIVAYTPMPVSNAGGHIVKNQDMVAVITRDTKQYWALRLTESSLIYSQDEDAIDQAIELIEARERDNEEMFSEIIESMRLADED